MLVLLCQARNLCRCDGQQHLTTVANLFDMCSFGPTSPSFYIFCPQHLSLSPQLDPFLVATNIIDLLFEQYFFYKIHNYSNTKNKFHLHLFMPSIKSHRNEMRFCFSFFLADFCENEMKCLFSICFRFCVCPFFLGFLKFIFMLRIYLSAVYNEYFRC